MKAQGYCHFNDDGKNTSFTINLFETDLQIEQDPSSRDLGHGAVVWDASVVLVKYMEKNYKDYDTSKLANKTVLELGSGCGLGGIAFMMKGAKVTCTDLENVTQRLTERNVQAVYRKLKASLVGKISAQTIEPSVYPIDWTHNPICLKEKEVISTGKPTQLTEMAADSVDVNEVATKLKSALEVTEPENTGGGTQKVFHTKFIDGKSMETGGSSFDLLVADAPYDYVVLTDCVFAKELAVPLVNSILCCCGPRTTVICCHEIRDEDANAAFIETLTKHFTMKRIPRNKLHENYCNDLIEVIVAKPIRAKKVSTV